MSFTFDILVEINEEKPHIIIPRTITAISFDMLQQLGVTDAIETITVEEGNPFYHSAGNCLIETRTGTLILGCKNSVIPTDGSVSKIGRLAFNGCQALRKLIIPEGIEEIGYMAFAFSGIEEISIPYSVSEIGALCFALNPQLKAIDFKSGDIEIGSMAFGTCDELAQEQYPFPVDKANKLKLIIPDVVKFGEDAVYRYAIKYDIPFEEK